MDKWATITHFAFAKFSPIAWILPKSIFCLLVYFTVDGAGNDALVAPYPAWYVRAGLCLFGETETVKFHHRQHSCSFSLLFFFRHPYDSQTPAGYAVATVVQCITASFLFMFLSTGASLASGAFIILLAVVKDLKGNLNLIQKMAQHKHTRSRMFELIVHFIDLHSHAKELSVQKFN